MAACLKISRGGILEKFSARGYTKNTPTPYSRFNQKLKLLIFIGAALPRLPVCKH